LQAVIAVRISIHTDAQHNGSFPDVGGGAVKNEVRNNLARISLRWMIRQCFILKTGILFHRNMFKKVGLEADNLWPKVKPRPSSTMSFSGQPPAQTRPTPDMGPSRVIDEVTDFVSEEEEDLADARSPINDMLKIGKSWWILEFVPQKIRFQNDEDSWISKLSCVIFLRSLSDLNCFDSINRGRGRVIPKQKSEGVKMHRTVKLRMELQLDDGKYKPRAKMNPDLNPTWID